jgi:O6-methylguanine-DNA--protein-cysteine methyltransferase
VTCWSEVASPIGALLLVGEGGVLSGVYMERHRHGPEPETRSGQRDDFVFRAVREQFESYFAGQLTVFDLPLAPQGTEFQQRVWTALRDIPYGETIAMRSWRGGSGNRRRCAPSEPPTAGTRSRSSCPVTGSSALMDR